MRIRNWRRKISLLLASMGMVAPIAVHAAPLNTNLVINSGFENVDLGATSFYNSPQILDWNSTIPGFAYSHDLSGELVPDFANGGPLSSGGHWYFTPGNGGNSSLADALVQDIDVSAGPTAEAISSGHARFDLNAFFSTYSDQADRAFIQADFLDSGATSVGSAMISSPLSPALATWTEFAANGMLPASTKTIRLSSWGEVFEGSGGSPDGYTDNVSFVVSAALPADFNEDGRVDSLDLARWKTGFGMTGAALHSQGDADADLDVDGVDFLLWQQQLQPVGGSSAVPEPQTIVLAGAAVAVAARFRRAAPK